MPGPLKSDHQSASYDGEVNASSYSYDKGLLVIPVMGPDGTPPKVIRVHAPVGYRKVQWSYKKRATPPIMPSMSDTPSGDLFLTGDLSLPVPALGGAQNQLDYVAAGEYTYVQNVSGSGARIAEYSAPSSVSQVSAMRKFQTGRHPYFTPSLAAAILAAGGVQQQNQQTLQGWPDMDQGALRKVSANALVGDIDFNKESYSYYDTTISSLFFSDSLIL